LKAEFLRTAGKPDCSSTPFQSGGQGSSNGDLYTQVALLEVEPIQMLGSNFKIRFNLFGWSKITFHFFIFSYSLDTVETVETDQQLSLTLRRGKKVLELQMCRRVLLSTWQDWVLGKIFRFHHVSPCFTPNLVVKYCKNHGYPVDFA